MSSTILLEPETAAEADPIEEIRLRTWARQNYMSADNRDGDWHPIVLDEMARIDRERRN